MWLILARIGAFVPGLFGKELSLKAAKVVGAIVAVVLVIAVLSVGKCAYDASVIERHDDKRTAKIEKGAREAEHAADENALERANRAAEDAANLQGAIDNARRDDPEGVRRPTGRATNDVYDELRRQRQAR